MNIDTEILETIEKMPEYLKQELLHYAKYLMENYSKDISPEQHPQDLSIASICGVFLIIISDIYTTISVFA